MGIQTSNQNSLVYKAEYIALSTATREILPMLILAKEAAKHNLIQKVNAPLFHCKLFKDNQGPIELVKLPIYLQRHLTNCPFTNIITR
jgi:hypothetical protein